MDAGRLQGWRRYDSRDGIGRVESGTETERTSGTRSRGRATLDAKAEENSLWKQMASEGSFHGEKYGLGILDESR